MKSEPLRQIGDKKLSEMTLEELQQQKIEARERLLAMDPEEAQEQVNQVLFPQMWKPIDMFEWEETIEPEDEANA